MYPISSYPFRVSAVGIFSLLALGTPVFGQAADGDPLPAIAFQFKLDAPMYRPKLGDPNVLALESTFADSVRSMLEARFRFLGWDRTSSKDTLTVRVHPSGEKDDKNLYLTIKVRAESLYTMFERNSERKKRADLSVRAITADWCKILNTALATKAAELVDILGQLPIKAVVAFKADDSTKVKVFLRPAALRLSPLEAAPGFRLSALQVSRDSVPDSPRTFAELELSPCFTAPGFFECGIVSIKYGGIDYSDERPLYLIRQILSATKSLHIGKYRADARTVANTGLSIQ